MIGAGLRSLASYFVTGAHRTRMFARPVWFRLCATLGCWGIVAGLASVWADRPAYDPAVDTRIGIHLWAPTGRPLSAAVWNAEIQAIDAAGFRDVSIDTIRWVDPVQGRLTTGPTARQGGLQAQDGAEAAVVAAKQRGISVTLNPLVLVAGRSASAAADSGGSAWRGDLTFDNPRALGQFWEDYTTYLSRIAAMAQRHRVGRLNVGSELVRLATDPEQQPYWHRLIDRVDAIYSGRIGYNANHTQFDHPTLAKNILEHPAIDTLSLSAYFSLASEAQADRSGKFGDAPFVRQVATRWTAIFQRRVFPYAAQLHGGKGLDVVVGEFGVIPYNRTAAKPWDWRASDREDAAEQYNVYRALIRATDRWRRRLPVLYLWTWSWQGGYRRERYGLRPGGTRPNERLSRPSAELWRRYLTSP